MSKSNLDDPVVKEIVQARVSLLFDMPFFGNLATRLELVEATGWCPTAATDGRKLYYNREFIKQLTREELIFLIGHEILHAVYDHIGRRGSRDPQLHNMATDYIVNYTLVKEGLGQMIKGGLYSEKYTDILTSEEVYNMLKENSVEIEMPLDMHLDHKDDSKDEDGKGKGQKGQPQQDCGSCGGSGKQDDGAGGEEECDACGGSGKEPGQGSGSGGTMKVTVTGDEDGPPSLSDEDLAQIRNEVKSAVISAAQSVGAGNVPAGVARLIEEITEPKMDWRELLEMHIKSAVKDDYTFSRISRRAWGISRIGGRSMILPGAADQDTVDVVCTIDTSGSMTQQMLTDFLSEVKGIMDMFPDFKLQLFTFDTQVYDHRTFTPENIDEILEYPMSGGGGTMFECVWEFLKKEEIEPNKLVLFTDGYPCGSWGDEDYCDTLFIIHGSHSIQPPFGAVAHYDDHND